MNTALTTNQTIATDFLTLVVVGRIDEAYEKYVDMNGKHHNAFYPAGFAPLKQGMKDNHTQFPHKKITVKNIVGDGDLVAVHSHLELKPGELGMIVVHIMRFHGGKIVELWDCGQPIPADSPNQDGIF